MVHSHAFLMREEDLAKVMTGAETAPEELGEGATDTQRLEHTKALREYCEKNGKLLTRLLPATSDHAGGYSSTAAKLVMAFAPVEDADDKVDGRGAVITLNTKYQRHGEARVHDLHDAISALKVTSANGFDPARIIMQLRCIFVELRAQSPWRRSNLGAKKACITEIPAWSAIRCPQSRPGVRRRRSLAHCL